ncbi:hypothetical protein [Hyphomonas sp. UBA4494]|jgi:hypothetical protein|nr:hypothetical protein [Hyphomonas sp. UBA4494]
MTKSKEDKDFNETLKRLMEKDPKPHGEMKKGREPKPAPNQGSVKQKRT